MMHTSAKSRQELEDFLTNLDTRTRFLNLKITYDSSLTDMHFFKFENLFLHTEKVLFS